MRLYRNLCEWQMKAPLNHAQQTLAVLYVPIEVVVQKATANVGAVARLCFCTANTGSNYRNLFFPDFGQIGVWQMQRQRHIPAPHRNYGRGKLCV